MSWQTSLRKAKKTAPEAVFEFSRPTFALADVDWSRLVTVDFETYFDTDYTLKKMSTSEYIRDPRFKAQMVGIKIGNKATKWYGAKKVKAALQAINWATHSVLCHNVQFDGFILSHHYGIKPAYYYDTLSMARGLHSNEIDAGLDDVAKFYGGEGKIDGVLERTMGVRDWSPALEKDVGVYCVQDVDETYRIFTLMHKKFPRDEMALVHMTARMFCDPVLRVDIPRVEKELVREIDERRALFYGLIDPKPYYDDKTVLKTGAERALVGEERDMLIFKRLLGSNTRMVKFLEDAGAPVPMKVSPAWMKLKTKAEREAAIDKKFTYAFAKDDRKFVDMPEDIDLWRGDLNPDKRKDMEKILAKQDYLKRLVQARLLTKSTTNMTRAERFLKAGANGMPLPVGYAYYRAHCLTGDAEVLTLGGWSRLDEWQGGAIAQWSDGGGMSFKRATPNIFEIDENIVEARARYHSANYTLGHTIPAYTSTGKFKPRKAGVAAGSRFELPLCGRLDGEASITSLDAQIAVMVQADGNIRTDVSQGRCVRFGFKKARKITRCVQLLEAACVPYIRSEEPNGVVRIKIGAVDMHLVLKLLDPATKTFLPYLLNAPLATKLAFIDEVSLWDSNIEPHRKGFTFVSTNRYNAEFVQTMAHLSGHSAHFATKGERPHGWSDAYAVCIRKDQTTRSMPESYSFRRHTGKVYCPTTETGFFLMRQHGKIVVTGNTGRWGGNNKMNMQNLTRGGELRLSILAAAAHHICVVDSGQIEARMNAWLWDQTDLLDAFKRSSEYEARQLALPKDKRKTARGLDRDAYCLFASEVYQREITKDDFIERFVGKTCVLGLGYQMGAAKLQITLAKGTTGPAVFLTLEECQRIVTTYRTKNYKIKEGWAKCSEIIEQMALGIPGAWKCISWEQDTLWLPNGMSLKYPDLRKGVNEENGWEEWTYAVKDTRAKIYGGLLCENIVQALSRIVIGLQMLEIDKSYRIVMTTHDEAVAHPKKTQADKCYALMHKVFTTPPAWCASIPLAAEGGHDVNYSK